MKKIRLNTTTGEPVIKNVIAEIKLPGIKGYKFYLHTAIEKHTNKRNYAITEESTGFSIVSGFGKAECEMRAIRIAKKHKQAGLEKAIKRCKRMLAKLNKRRQDPFYKALDESGVVLTETEERDLKDALIKHEFSYETAE